MSMTSRLMPPRALALGAGLALSLSVAAPAFAADTPDGAVQDVLSAIEAKDFEGLSGYFCPEFADAAGAFDLGGLAAGLPPEVDPAVILDALALEVAVSRLEVIEQADTEATVGLAAELSMGINPDGVGPLVELFLAASGMEVTPDMVEMMGSMVVETLATELEGQTQDISADVRVTNADGQWLVCDDLDGTGSSEPPAASEAPAASEVPAEPEAPAASEAPAA